MGSLEDMEMQTLLSRMKDNIVQINKIQEECNEHIQCLPSLNKCNKNLFEEVMTMLNDLKKKEAENRYLNIEKGALCSAQCHVDQCLKDKLINIEKLQKTNKEIINAIDSVHSDVYKHLSNYEATLEAIANNYKESSKFYNEEYVRAIIQETDVDLQNIKEEINDMAEKTDTLQVKLETMKEDVAEDLLFIIGKEQLENEMKSLTLELEKSQRIYDNIVK